MAFFSQALSVLEGFNYISVLFRIVLAAAVGGLIGNERGKHGNPAGLRTHILVCVGSALTSLTSVFSIEVLGNSGDMFRISAQVMSGIGFLGAGIILIKDNSTVRGLTTAAGMWTTAAIGVAAGYGFYWGVTVTFLIYIFSVTALTRFERKRKGQSAFYMEINNIKELGRITDEIHRDYPVEINILPPKSGIQNNVGLEVTVNAVIDTEDFLKKQENDTAVEFTVTL